MMYRSRGGVRRLELLHRPLLPGLQGVNQLGILHDVSLLFLLMSYYTPVTAKSHRIFRENFRAKRMPARALWEADRRFIALLRNMCI